MLLSDVNVLVYAHRPESPRHDEYHDWVDGMVNGEEPYGVTDVVLNGFLRVVTSHRIYREPTPVDSALDFADRVRSQPHAAVLNPRSAFWRIFGDLARRAAAKGTLMPDAYLAALAVEHGCEFVSTDRDFARFPGLRWRHPLE